ncbi:hypothetical protein CYMTET_16924 [Cymbomonas tetramitiformis]|uniref:Uncharacterized protein n=1 Tax=Cymbomonas tetramitiformis TaxID=36881 RepID=A0AAE0L7N6_9CHLO|nr:hypothetical protein CYMTET_16924 [Cymbomonas tetramitiformis]
MDIDSAKSTSYLGKLPKNTGTKDEDRPKFVQDFSIVVEHAEGLRSEWDGPEEAVNVAPITTTGLTATQADLRHPDLTQEQEAASDVEYVLACAQPWPGMAVHPWGDENEEGSWSQQRLFVDRTGYARVCKLWGNDEELRLEAGFVHVTFARCGEEKDVLETELLWPDFTLVDLKVNKETKVASDTWVTRARWKKDGDQVAPPDCQAHRDAGRYTMADVQEALSAQQVYPTGVVTGTLMWDRKVHQFCVLNEKTRVQWELIKMMESTWLDPVQIAELAQRDGQPVFLVPYRYQRGQAQLMLGKPYDERGKGLRTCELSSKLMHRYASSAAVGQREHERTEQLRAQLAREFMNDLTTTAEASAPASPGAPPSPIPWRVVTAPSTERRGAMKRAQRDETTEGMLRAAIEKSDAIIREHDKAIEELRGRRRPFMGGARMGQYTVSNAIHDDRHGAREPQMVNEDVAGDTFSGLHSRGVLEVNLAQRSEHRTVINIALPTAPEDIHSHDTEVFLSGVQDQEAASHRSPQVRDLTGRHSPWRENVHAAGQLQPGAPVTEQ